MSLSLRTVSEFYTSALISSQKQINHIDKEANENFGGAVGTHVGRLCQAISKNIDTNECHKLKQFFIQLTVISAKILQQLSSPILQCINQVIKNLEISYKIGIQSNGLETNNFHEQTNKLFNALSCSIRALEKFDILATNSGVQCGLEAELVTLCDDKAKNEEYTQYVLDIKRSFLNGLVVICEEWYGQSSSDLDVLSIIAKMAEKIEKIAANKSCVNENAPSHAVNQVFATFLRSVLEGLKVAHSFDGVTLTKGATSHSSDDVIEIFD